MKFEMLMTRMMRRKRRKGRGRVREKDDEECDA